MDRIFKAGLALQLTVRVTGGIQYQRTGKGKETLADGAVRESWDTVKTTENPEEHAQAITLRAKVRNTITRLCARTPIGDLLLVPPEREQEVREALKDCAALVESHNSTARSHFIVMGAVPSRIMPDDEWSTRSIVSEMLACMAMMETGIAGADTERIRDGADSLRHILPMVDAADPKMYLLAAVEAGRDAARELTRRVEKKGEDPADVVAEVQTKYLPPIDYAKMALIDSKREAA